MRTILIAAMAVALPASIAAAEQPGRLKLDPAPNREQSLPLKRGAGSGDACAAFGPGFVKVQGTGTCVKLGGSVQIGAGASR
jgi:hypothetical protein